MPQVDDHRRDNLTLICWKYIMYIRGGLMISSILLRRFVAFIFDGVYFIPGAIFFALFNKLPFVSLIFLFLIFILRDIFSKRSFGKRVMELNIIDKNTGKPASAKQKIIRNLFAIICYIDYFALIIKGESLGDKVANTIIVKT